MGKMFATGSEVCLDLGAGKKAFVCTLHQNVTNWSDTGRSCPES